ALAEPLSTLDSRLSTIDDCLLTTVDCRLTHVRAVYPPYLLAMTRPKATCSPPNPAAMKRWPHSTGATNAAAPSSMKHSPISGTTRTDHAPPVATAAPYSSSQQPGSLAMRPYWTKTAVKTIALANGARNAS